MKTHHLLSLLGMTMLVGCANADPSPTGFPISDDPSRGGATTASNDATESAPPASPPATPDVVAAPGSGSKRVVGYFTAWSVYARNYHVADIPAQKLTHLNYGFANVSTAGECVLGDSWADTDQPYPGDSTEPGALRGSFHQLELLKQRTPGLKTMLSVGGWTWSANFSSAASSALGRAKLASSCVGLAKKYGFDGLDIDWEYPVSGGLVPGVAADKPNFTLLLAELRSQLTAAGGGLLTIAAPGSVSVAANLELAKVASLVDWMNLMAYDLHGPWDPTTGFTAALHPRPGDSASVESAVTAYLAAKVPADKIVLGMPLYGRGFAGVSAGGQGGLGQSFSGLPSGTWEPGIFDYKALTATYVTTMSRSWDPVAMTPWLYDPTTKVFVTYDDAQSVLLKGRFLFDHGLGGGMFWDLSADDPKASLVDVLRSQL